MREGVRPNLLLMKRVQLGPKFCPWTKNGLWGDITGFFCCCWIYGPLPSPPLFLQHSSSPFRASWERWAQTAGLVKDPSWDADNVLARRLPCSLLASASLIKTQNSTRNGYLFLSCFPPPFVELFLSAIPLIQRNNQSQVGQDNAAADSFSVSERTNCNMEEPSGRLNMPSGLFLSHSPNWVKVGGAATSFLPLQCKPISGFVWKAEPCLTRTTFSPFPPQHSE